MAYFVKLGVGNIIEKSVVVSNDIATTEQAGIDFLNDLYGSRDVWKQTFIDGSQRKNFAGIGYTYNQNKDAFISPQPYPSWILNEDTCIWEAPQEYPDDDKKYLWNEQTTSWKEIE
tara:strand:- start:408 stop:755 length:348 start_codon:yes stop_codon:yes gene_type:complete